MLIAIKTLGVEHDSVSKKLKNITNQTGVIDVDVFPEDNITNQTGVIDVDAFPEEMIRVSRNPSQLQQHRELLQQLGQQVFGKQ